MQDIMSGGYYRHISGYYSWHENGVLELEVLLFVHQRFVLHQEVQLVATAKYDRGTGMQSSRAREDDKASVLFLDME